MKLYKTEFISLFYEPLNYTWDISKNLCSLFAKIGPEDAKLDKYEKYRDMFESLRQLDFDRFNQLVGYNNPALSELNSTRLKVLSNDLVNLWSSIVDYLKALYSLTNLKFYSNEVNKQKKKFPLNVETKDNKEYKSLMLYSYFASDIKRPDMIYTYDGYDLSISDDGIPVEIINKFFTVVKYSYDIIKSIKKYRVDKLALFPINTNWYKDSCDELLTTLAKVQGDKSGKILKNIKNLEAYTKNWKPINLKNMMIREHEYHNMVYQVRKTKKHFILDPLDIDEKSIIISFRKDIHEFDFVYFNKNKELVVLDSSEYIEAVDKLNDYYEQKEHLKTDFESLIKFILLKEQTEDALSHMRDIAEKDS